MPQVKESPDQNENELFFKRFHPRPVEKGAVNHCCLNPKMLEVTPEQNVHVDALCKKISTNLEKEGPGNALNKWCTV